VAHAGGNDLGGVFDRRHQSVDAFVQLLGPSPGDRHQDVVLAVEIVVEAAAGDFGGIGDVVDGDGVDTALAHEPFGGLQNPASHSLAAPRDAAGRRSGFRLGGGLGFVHGRGP
jgi:hypothetical protein